MNSPRWCWRCCRPAAIAPKLDDAVVEQIRNLDGDYHFETFVSLTCQSCPDVVQALNAMAALNPKNSPYHDRWRSVPGRSRAARSDGRACGFPERQAVRPGPHGACRDHSSSWMRERQALRPRNSTPRRPSMCWSWAADLRVPQRRSTRRARAFAPASPPSAWRPAARYGRHRELHFREGDARPQTGERAWNSMSSPMMWTS